MGVVLTITIPLPPALCSPNRAGGNHHLRRKAVAGYRRACFLAGVEQIPDCWQTRPLRVHHRWFLGQTEAEAQRDSQRRMMRAACRNNPPKYKSSPLVYQPLDVQNAIASLKAGIDGLVDAGLLPNDSKRWLQWGECELLSRAEDHGDRSEIELRFEELVS